MTYITESPSVIATTTSNCDHILPLLTSREVYEQKLVGHRYYVQLVSKDWELQDDHPVPRKSEVIDLVVTEPTEAAIRELVESVGWLSNWRIVDFWQEPPVDGYCPF
jgi:hypothetical protein